MPSKAESPANDAPYPTEVGTATTGCATRPPTTLASAPSMSREVQNRDTNLRESEECFRLTANSIKDALILLSGDGKIIFWNRAAEQIFGYTAEEAMGRVLHDLLIPDRHRASVAKGLNDFVRSGQGIFCGTGIEINATRKNGQEFAIELSLSSMVWAFAYFKALANFSYFSTKIDYCPRHF